MSDTNRTAQESADYLAESLNQNTAALEGVRRRYRLTLALVVFVAITMFIAFKFNHDGNVSRCKTGNELREQIDTKFQSITEFLTIAGVGDTAEGQDFLALLEEDLEPRDCSDIGWFGA